MLKRKRIREKGKIRMSIMFQELKKGDTVALMYDPSSRPFPRRFHGKKGIVLEKRGRAYLVSFFDGKKEKKLVLKAINLKKLSSS